MNTPTTQRDPMQEPCTTPTQSVQTVRDPKVFSDSLRKNLLELEEQTRQGIKQLKSVPSVDGEVIAQMTLALRHIEDARMRYGKVIQYLGDGQSIYDKPSQQQPSQQQPSL